MSKIWHLNNTSRWLDKCITYNRADGLGIKLCDMVGNLINLDNWY